MAEEARIEEVQQLGAHLASNQARVRELEAAVAAANTDTNSARAQAANSAAAEQQALASAAAAAAAAAEAREREAVLVARVEGLGEKGTLLEVRVQGLGFRVWGLGLGEKVNLLHRSMSWRQHISSTLATH
jgi:hypothetical protein